MKTLLLAFSLVASGVSVYGGPTFQRSIVPQRNDNGPLSCVSAVEAPEGVLQGTPMLSPSPMTDYETMTANPKVLTYISPGTFFGMTNRILMDKNGGYEIMSGYAGDLLARFKGNKITAINAAVDPGVETVTLFIKNANFETVFEKELEVAPLEPNEVPKPDGGTLTYGSHAEVAVDYEITGETFYVGYSLKAPEDAYYGMFYMPAQCNSYKNAYIVDTHGGNGPVELSGLIPYIWCDTEGDGGLASYDVALNGVASNRTFCGEDYVLSGTFINYGAQPIDELTFTYTGGDGLSHELKMKSDDKFPYLTNLEFTIPVQADTEPGVYEKVVAISEVNGHKDEYDTDNIKTSYLVAVKDAVDRRILIDEYTGTWCGFCTRGMAAADVLNENYADDVVLTQWHYNDEIAVDDPDYVTMGSWVNGYPNTVVNHCMTADPWSGLEEDVPFGMGLLVENLKAKPVETSIEAVAYYEASTDLITVNSTITSTLDVVDGSIYEIGFTVVEDGYEGMQTNSYSYEKNYWPKEELPEALWPYYDLPTLFECTYDDVVRQSYGALGNPGSVGSVSFNAGEPMTFSSSFTPENINDINKVDVVAYVMDSSTKEVLNVVKTPLSVQNSVNTYGINSFVAKRANGISVNAEGEFTADVFAVNGGKIASVAGNGSADVTLPVCHGIYVVVVKSAAGASTTKIVL